MRQQVVDETRQLGQRAAILPIQQMHRPSRVGQPWAARASLQQPCAQPRFLTDTPIRQGANTTAVNAAVEGFVRAAASKSAPVSTACHKR